MQLFGGNCMGTYMIPRNTKGEGRILFIFSTKALIYTVVGGLIGMPFYYLFKFIKMNIVGIVIIALFLSYLPDNNVAISRLSKSLSIFSEDF